ncbi:MAG: hypothetical protein M1587_11810 [Thaumarchaeota archaeon]|nr:hypothetical protein [Nitrososphaerota archaeon]
MPKWKEGINKYVVGVGYSENRGYACTIPRPVIQVLGEPEKIAFVVKDGKVEVLAEEPSH